eukprot:CAMPEP_0202895954 /NCGR_PEP_ID=MMETSP1392-20130828/5052_1 /ASSEMBLY_ACC=CAM_ASM_000868 /TAXON_ID=225041 /ORGANISM="Chlamydomonas chlamydogama, Strain SAG 11-48b" /LENGTH=319 /DNA_ID=CAMNT_0049581151 /DNA_START=210 /DNA_END=1168 /DNA_ORIENTATION=-
MSLETMFSVGQDDGLFPILPNELEDLFSDDLIHFFKPEELILADTDAVVPAEVNVPRVEAAAPQSSGPSSGGSTSSLTLCPESTALPAQRSTGPSAKSGCKKTQPGPLRLVTTEAPPAEAGAKEAVTEHSPQAAAASPNAAASDNMVDTDSEDSNFTEDDAMNTDEPAQPTTTKVNKRKAPEIDWRSIEDPAERRRQRRLAKNRVTAARSRERKKVQWADMELKLSAVQNENRELKTMLDRLSRENNDLRNQLAMIAPGTTAGMRGNSYSNAEPAAARIYNYNAAAVLCPPGRQGRATGVKRATGGAGSAAQRKRKGNV